MRQLLRQPAVYGRAHRPADTPPPPPPPPSGDWASQELAQWIGEGWQWVFAYNLDGTDAGVVLHTPGPTARDPRIFRQGVYTAEPFAPSDISFPQFIDGWCVWDMPSFTRGMGTMFFNTPTTVPASITGPTSAELNGILAASAFRAGDEIIFEWDQWYNQNMWETHFLQASGDTAPKYAILGPAYSNSSDTSKLVLQRLSTGKYLSAPHLYGYDAGNNTRILYDIDRQARFDDPSPNGICSYLNFSGQTGDAPVIGCVYQLPETIERFKMYIRCTGRRAANGYDILYVETSITTAGVTRYLDKKEVDIPEFVLRGGYGCITIGPYITGINPAVDFGHNIAKYRRLSCRIKKAIVLDPTVRGAGVFDGADSSGAWGWAVDLNNKNKKLTVGIYHNSTTLLGTILATASRPDVLSVTGFGDGNNGFLLPWSLAPGTYSVTGKIEDDGSPLSGGPFTVTVVSSGPPDTVAPTFSGTLAVSTVTSSSFTLTWPNAADNVGVTGYEYSTDGGSTWTSAGNVLTKTVTGRIAETVYQVRVRAFDAAGNRSPALAATVTTLPSSTPPGELTPAYLDGLTLTFTDIANSAPSIYKAANTASWDTAGNQTYTKDAFHAFGAPFVDQYAGEILAGINAGHSVPNLDNGIYRLRTADDVPIWDVVDEATNWTLLGINPTSYVGARLPNGDINPPHLYDSAVVCMNSAGEKFILVPFQMGVQYASGSYQKQHIFILESATRPVGWVPESQAPADFIINQYPAPHAVVAHDTRPGGQVWFADHWGGLYAYDPETNTFPSGASFWLPCGSGHVAAGADFDQDREMFVTGWSRHSSAAPALERFHIPTRTRNVLTLTGSGAAHLNEMSYSSIIHAAYVNKYFAMTVPPDNGGVHRALMIDADSGASEVIAEFPISSTSDGYSFRLKHVVKTRALYYFPDFTTNTKVAKVAI